MLLSWKLFSTFSDNNEFCHQHGIERFQFGVFFRLPFAMNFDNNGTTRGWGWEWCKLRVHKKPLIFVYCIWNCMNWKCFNDTLNKRIFFNGNCKIPLNLNKCNLLQFQWYCSRDTKKSSAKSCVSTFKLMTSTWCLVTNRSSCKKMSKHNKSTTIGRLQSKQIQFPVTSLCVSIPSDLSYRMFKNHCLNLHGVHAFVRCKKWHIINLNLIWYY